MGCSKCPPFGEALVLELDLLSRHFALCGEGRLGTRLVAFRSLTYFPGVAFSRHNP
jgi:hypothetical protein